MKDVSSLDAIECIAGLVLQLLRCPCGTPEHAVEATVSVGIAMSDDQAPCTFDALYDNACAALFDAKRAKDHRFVIYDCNGKPARGKYGFNRLVNASTPNYQPFLETLANGGVLLRAEPKGPIRSAVLQRCVLGASGRHGIINADSEAGLRDLYDSIVQGE